MAACKCYKFSLGYKLLHPHVMHEDARTHNNIAKNVCACMNLIYICFANVLTNFAIKVFILSPLVAAFFVVLPKLRPL